MKCFALLPTPMLMLCDLWSIRREITAMARACALACCCRRSASSSPARSSAMMRSLSSVAADATPAASLAASSASASSRPCCSSATRAYIETQKYHMIVLCNLLAA